MPIISLRLGVEDYTLFKKYAKMHEISLSEFVRKYVLEKNEDEYDLKACEEATEDRKKNPTTYTLDEVEKELGLK